MVLKWRAGLDRAGTKEHFAYRRSRFMTNVKYYALGTPLRVWSETATHKQ